MKKVLCIAWHLSSKDGWGTLGRTTAIGLISAGHEVEMLLQEGDPEIPCVQHIELPGPMAMLHNPFRWFRAYSVIKKRIRIFKPDVIHVLTEPYMLMRPFFGKRIPWVLTLCGTYSLLPLHNWKTRALMLRAYAGIAHFLSISRYTRRRVIEELHSIQPSLAHAVDARTSIVQLGLAIPATMPPAPQNTTKQLLFVGGVKKRKGVLEIIHACHRFRSTSSQLIHLHIIGGHEDAAYLQEVHSAIAAFQMNDCVTLEGKISDSALDEFYAKSDLLLMLSKPHQFHFEGFGLVFLEANARGIPVIGPDSSGCTDAVSEGVSGYSVNPDDADLVAERMRWILEEKRIPRESCRKWAEDHSITRQTQDCERAYAAALKE